MLRGLSGVEDAQAELLNAYSTGEESDPAIHERLERAKLFHVLILVKIVARRVPIYEKDWGVRTAQLIERASQVLAQAQMV
jgi:hypothetical protein